MITLNKDSELVFSFPEVDKWAELRVSFQRTLRIPDDGKTHFLPPGLGVFPLAHVDDHAANVPPAWIEHGGVMLPMYQSEAMWIYFSGAGWSETGYPFAVKVAAGKIDAVSGKLFKGGLGRDPQDYIVTPGQPWLDGFCVDKGVIRQFVAMPLGAGYTAEEQLTGEAEFGGIQIVAYPMKREAFERLRVEMARQTRFEDNLLCCREMDMGLAPGGRMKQDIFADPHELADWDLEHSSRCFVHIANSLVWRRITGHEPPTTPITAAQYTEAGLPWFDYYDDKLAAVEGSKELAGIKSVAEMGKKKGDVPLPENEPVSPKKVIVLRKGLQRDQVREWK